MGARKELLKNDPKAAVTWVHFVPFGFGDGNGKGDGEGGFELFSVAEKWAEIKNKDLQGYPEARYKVLFYTGDVLSTLQLLGPTDVVYVTGHSSPGADSIRVHADSGKILAYHEVCGRLVESGLQEKFAGAIKFYHCFGGSKGSSTLSFAERCAALLAKWGYRLCKVYGYKGKVCAKSSPDKPKAVLVPTTGEVRDKPPSDPSIRADFTASKSSDEELVDTYKAVVGHPKPKVG